MHTPKIILKINTPEFIGVVKNGAITPAVNHATDVVVKKFASSLICF